MYRPCVNSTPSYRNGYVVDRCRRGKTKTKNNIYILKAQTVAATLMQPCLARNTLLYHLLYKYTACFFFLNLEIQCYSEIHLNIMHTHYAQLTIGKEEEERKQDLTEKY